ncbi:acyl-CoA thioesterase [uncultured Ilyobacter sp.]|uniref:acyl-CoA thioesterase n=1 Tax=uncultured Ilyobacter sp. TaxID=544433 RepID=UPI0029C05575|nr:acyl-CoA thioesterase [uncultured Ilyobacter sp.]
MSMEYTGFQNEMEPALRLVAMPADTNPAGDVFGGWIMAQVDLAGAVIASQRAQSRIVTIKVTDFIFKEPVYVGDLVTCYGKIEKIGTTSITVKVVVCAQRNRYEKTCIKVTEATVVYVAIDEDGNPKEISK